jgi:hypothetical protein
MKATRQPTRGGILGKAKINNHLQVDCITLKFSPLNAFYALVVVYWLVLVWGLL